jgi:hypothetical protein
MRAELYARSRSLEDALSSVSAAVDAGLHDRAWLDRCPLFEPLHADPRWLALVDRVAERTRPVLVALDEPPP